MCKMFPHIYCVCMGNWGRLKARLYFFLIYSVDVIFQTKISTHKKKSVKKVGRQTSTYLCDVLNEVFAKGESAAYEPHGDHMMGQGHDVLIEPDGNGRNKQVRVCLCVQEYTCGCVYESTHLEGLV